MNNDQIIKAIANDLIQCDIGITLTKGKLKQQYINHHKKCFKEIARINSEEGFDNMSDDEILAALNQ